MSAKRTVQLGQRVQPGTATMAVIPLDQLWIDANFKETQLRDMRIGQPVDIVADLVRQRREVQRHRRQPGRRHGSAFALLPAQNATGNWIKIVQRVPVRIHINPKQLAEAPAARWPEHPVDVDLHDQSGPCWRNSRRKRPRSPPSVIDRQLVEADTLIARLIHDNSAASGKTGSDERAGFVHPAKPAADHHRPVAGDVYAGARHHHRQRRLA